MLVRAVSGVDDAALDGAGEHFGRAGRAVTDDDDVDSHRLDVAGGVDECFALADAAAFFGKVDDVRREARSGQRKTGAGAGGIFEESVDYHAAAEGGNLFDAAGRDLGEGLGSVEDEADLFT